MHPKERFGDGRPRTGMDVPHRPVARAINVDLSHRFLKAWLSKMLCCVHRPLRPITIVSVARKDMFVVLYRWRLHEGHEEEFVDAWSRTSDIYLKEFGSLGSRLHKGSDGLWYSYAQWPSEQARKEAFSNGAADADASARMERAIAERFLPVVLDVRADFLQYPSAEI